MKRKRGYKSEQKRKKHIYTGISQISVKEKGGRKNYVPENIWTMTVREWNHRLNTKPQTAILAKEG